MVQSSLMSQPIEDLPAAAARQFDQAALHCVGCRPYHALWGYLRLTRQIGGVEADEPHLAPLLTELVGHKLLRILIAGSADSGVMAMVHRATLHSGQRHQFIVVDRCHTPLVTCRRYAAEQGLDLHTMQTDIRDLALDGGADLVIGHSVLQFFESSQHRTALLALHRALAPGGRLVLVSRLAAAGRERTQLSRSPAEWAQTLASNMLDGLQERQLTLPCALPEFVDLINTYVQRAGFHVCPHEDEQGLRSDLEAAGFRVEHLAAVGRGMEFVEGGQINRSGRQGIVAVTAPKGC